VARDNEAALPADAKQAWEAYLAMCESKQAYFSLLSEVDEKYKTAGQPTQDESERLAELLQRHDECVMTFNQAMAAVTDPASRQALLLKLQKASEG
jgi:D-serine deaminase-like pyridoxal phosphate-dependent protein